MWPLLVTLCWCLRYSQASLCYDGTEMEHCKFSQPSIQFGSKNSPDSYKSNTEHSLPVKLTDKSDLPVVLSKYDGEELDRQMREDVSDRVDHFTQYLSDMNINTEEEITSLQASEIEEEEEKSLEQSSESFGDESPLITFISEYAK